VTDVKTNHLIAILLLLLGTNLMTFAATRYWTTSSVLTAAQKRMDAALKKEGLYEQVYPSDRPRSVALILAIPDAGGMYYWWNEALVYFAVGVVVSASGLAVTRYNLEC
jgi:hypothetical protein